jgi:hypothetical protein
MVGVLVCVGANEDIELLPIVGIPVGSLFVATSKGFVIGYLDEDQDRHNIMIKDGTKLGILDQGSDSEEEIDCCLC